MRKMVVPTSLQRSYTKTISKKWAEIMADSYPLSIWLAIATIRNEGKDGQLLLPQKGFIPCYGHISCGVE
jgi:hypothetical protein